MGEHDMVYICGRETAKSVKKRWDEIDERRKFTRRWKFMITMGILLPLLCFVLGLLITVRIMDAREAEYQASRERIIENSNALGAYMNPFDFD